MLHLFNFYKALNIYCSIKRTLNVRTDAISNVNYKNNNNNNSNNNNNNSNYNNNINNNKVITIIVMK